MKEKLKQLYLCSFAPSISDSAVCEEGAKKFAELIWKEAYDQGYWKGVSDSSEGQGGV